MKKLKLYRITQDKNNDYDTYDSAVVAAESADDARLIHPGANEPDGKCDWEWENSSSWVKSPDMVDVECIGVAESGITRGVIVASFNAG